MHLGRSKINHHFPKPKINAPLFAHAAGITTRRNAVRSRHFPLLSVGCSELVGRRDVVFLWPLWSEFSTWNWGSHFRISYLTTVWPSKKNPNLRPNTSTMFPPRSFLQLNPDTSNEGSTSLKFWSSGFAVWGIFKNVYIYIYIQININKYINYYINSYKYHTLHPIQVVKTSLYYHVLPSKLYLLQDMFQWPHQNDHDSFKEKNTLSNQAVLPGWQHLIISMNSGEVPSAEVYIKYIFQNKSSFAMYPCQMMQGVHSKCLMSPYIYSLISNTMPKPPATTVPCKKKVNGNAGAGVASELVGRFPAWPARS